MNLDRIENDVENVIIVSRRCPLLLYFDKRYWLKKWSWQWTIFTTWTCGMNCKRPSDRNGSLNLSTPSLPLKIFWQANNKKAHGMQLSSRNVFQVPKNIFLKKSLFLNLRRKNRCFLWSAELGKYFLWLWWFKGVERLFCRKQKGVVAKRLCFGELTENPKQKQTAHRGATAITPNFSTVSDHSKYFFCF